VRQGEYPLAIPSNTPVVDILAEYNAGIPGVVEKLRAEGKHVSTVNMWDLVYSDDELNEIGLHPKSVVGERMAQAWLEKIMEILDKPVMVSASPTLEPTPTEFPPPPPKFYVDAPLRIMPLGDATIEGRCDRSTTCVHPEEEWRFPRDGYGVDSCRTNWNDVNPGEKGFREFLRDKLVAAGVNMSYVGSVELIEGLAHEGHVFFMFDDFDYCIQNAKWLEQAKPDIILMHLGTTEAVYEYPPNDILEDLKGLLTRIYQELPETTEVIVAQNIPVRDNLHVGSEFFDPSKPLINDILVEYNAGIPAVVDEFRAAGKHVSYVDLRNTVQSTDEFDELGLQPNLVASERIAQVWFDKIMEILNQQE